ncbi:DNA-directed DNA polymerase [Tanacetum coccineum]
MRAFICEFRTTNEILFKERNNSLSELRFEVQELLKVINNTPMTNFEIKGVTTRGRKSTTHDVQNNSTNIHAEEPLMVNHDKPVESNEVLDKDQSKTNQTRHVIQTSSEQLHINFPFIEALAQMLKYAKFLNGLLTNKARLEETCTITMNERCSTVLLNKLPSKEKYPGSFTIPYDIGQLHNNNALADLGASISLLPYTMYEKLGLGEPKATRMSLERADRSIQYPRRIIENVLIKVDKFIHPIDFVILDMPEDSMVPIIFGRPFLATARAMIDIPPADDDECYGIDELDETINNEAQELLANDKLPMDFDPRKPIRRINSVNMPYSVAQETTRPDKVESEHLYLASANKIDEKKPELKNLPHQLDYAYLHGDKSFPIIISFKLSEKEKMSLLQVLEKCKGSIA